MSTQKIEGQDTRSWAAVDSQFPWAALDSIRFGHNFTNACGDQGLLAMGLVKKNNVQKAHRPALPPEARPGGELSPAQTWNEYDL